MKSSLDKMFDRFKYKIINIITNQTMFGPMGPEVTPDFSCGVFLEIDEYGLWILSLSKTRKYKKEMFYHDKILKIEEVSKIDIKEFPKEVAKEIEKCYQDYIQLGIEEELPEKDVPDVSDPRDQKKINEFLFKIQETIMENKSNDEKDFLEKRD
ncbi:MAG: hypothetical protein ACOCV1_05770 [Bacillota bacterium]